MIWEKQRKKTKKKLGYSGLENSFLTTPFTILEKLLKHRISFIRNTFSSILNLKIDYLIRGSPYFSNRRTKCFVSSYL